MVQSARARRFLPASTVGFFMLLAAAAAAAPLDDITTDVVSLPEPLAAQSPNYVLFETASFSPRLYLAPATATVAFAGWTDASGDGHVSRLADGVLVADHEYPATPVAGLVAHGDAAYGVLLRDAAGQVMRLRRSQADGAEVWTRDLANAVAVPVSDLGDARLAHGGGVYVARFANVGTGAPYDGHNGDQGAFVDDAGNILAGGWEFGPSHSMCQAAHYHDGADQLLTLAVSDCYPQKGIVAGTSDVIHPADANCAGYVSVGFGQLAARPGGWLLVFNGLETGSYAGQGIGLLSLDFDLAPEVTWLTSSSGVFERDPVMARIGDDPGDHTYLVGWRDAGAGSFMVAVIDSAGTFLEGPQDVSSAGVGWGNRDDSFRTLPGGGVAWLEGAAGAASLELHTYAGSPASASITIEVEPDAGSWELAGPDAFFATGTGDSTLVGLAPGDYTVTWLPLPGWLAPPAEQQSLAEGASLTFTAAYEAVPVITEVADVGPDQGGQVRLVWNRVVHDDPLEPVAVTGYEIYRRQDEAGAKLLGWDYLATVPAHGDAGYQMVVPTLCDSTVAGGVCWSVFIVRAVGDDPFVVFTSPPDSGYSTDDLAPGVPAGLHLAADDLLAWEEAVEADFRYFTLYGSQVDHLDGTAVVVGRTAGTGLDVAGHDHFYYHLTATDFAGNEGEAATLDAVSGVPARGPRRFALHGATPNPFNPLTTIAFEIPTRQEVVLQVFDLSGRLVRNLVAGEVRAPGRHEVVWNGRDDAGRPVASGTYFYRLAAGPRRATQRMVLVK